MVESWTEFSNIGRKSLIWTSLIQIQTQNNDIHRYFTVYYLPALYTNSIKHFSYLNTPSSKHVRISDFLLYGFPRQLSGCVQSQVSVPLSHSPAVSSDGSARVWDCGSAKCLATITNTHCPINACAVASNTALANQNTAPPTGKDAVNACMNTNEENLCTLSLIPRPRPSFCRLYTVQKSRIGPGIFSQVGIERVIERI